MRKQPQNKVVWVQAVQEWDDPLSHINHSSMPADKVQLAHCQAAEIPQFAFKICFFQVQDTHSFLKRKDTEDAAVVGKKNNSGWVYGTWSSRMILARCYLLFHKWKCFPHLNSRNKMPDAYLHRYSKGSRICKWTASPKRQEKYRITYFPSFFPSKNLLPKLMVDPVAATVLSTFLLLKEHHINSLLQCQQLTDLLHCLFTWSTKEKQIVILMFVCRALIQSLCKRTAREVVVISFQLFLTRYFLQPHPSAPTPYSKLGWPGSSSSLIPLAHNKQRQYSVLPGQDLAFINLHGRQWQQTLYGKIQALVNRSPKQAGTLKSSSQKTAALLDDKTVSFWCHCHPLHTLPCKTTAFPPPLPVPRLPTWMNCILQKKKTSTNRSPFTWNASPPQRRRQTYRRT